MDLKTVRVFLDDTRKPLEVFYYIKDIEYNKHWIVVKNYDQFVDMIQRIFKRNGKLPDMISFDHDLADIHYGGMNHGGEIKYENFSEKTGFHCAKWLVEFCMDNKLEIPKFKVHSMNPVGGENIRKYLENAKKHIN